MKIAFGTEYKRPVCMALGFFDSVHFAHREILRGVKEYSKACGVEPAVFTFSDNPHLTADDPHLVYTYDERIELFSECGIDIIVSALPDKALLNSSAEWFLSTLFDNINVKRVFCGYDYRFGKSRKGDVDLLKRYAEMRSIGVTIIDKIENNHERISTTLIKSLISRGEIPRANELLGRNFTATGQVVHGRGEGHLYNFPTANTVFPSCKLLPMCGVYATVAHIDGKSYDAASNVGEKPTFKDSVVSVETMISDFDGDLYGKTIRLEFIRYLRDIKRFDSPEQLSRQIHEDINWRKKC